MSVKKKRLIVLLVVAAWVSFVFIMDYNDYSPTGGSPYRTDLTLLMTHAFVWSLPAVLFGGILFWWFDKGRE